MASERGLIEAIRASARSLGELIGEAQFWRSAATRRIDAETAAGKDRAREKLADATLAAAAELRRAVHRAGGLADGLTAGMPAVAGLWSASNWETWTPRTQGLGADFLRIGELVEPHDHARFSMPALLRFPLDRPLVVVAGGAGRERAVAALQSVLLRALVGVPAGALKLTLVDPLGLGQNVATLMHLADHDESLVGNRAVTEARHVEQRLVDLTETIEIVIQKYLRDKYTSIEAYNRAQSDVPEPYRLLAVFDFPVNFSQDAARRLLSIAQSGPRCGVMTVVLYDPNQPAPHGFDVSELLRPTFGTCIVWDGTRFVWQDDVFRACELVLDQPPARVLGEQIVKAVGTAAVQAAGIQVPFERIAPPESAWWAASSQGGFSVPIGPSGAGKLQNFAMGSGTAHNALIAGRVGSGKSTLLHALIANLALTYGPSDLEMYLVDFKEGVEFKTYAVRRLPHARVIAIESEREFGLSVLEGLDAEIKRRGALFKRSSDDLGGVEIANLAAYRDRTGRPLPRLLLVMDEFQVMFAEDDKMAAEAARLLEDIVRRGRAFGIHAVLASQTLAGTPHLGRAILGQMAIRIALQCSEADSRLILADDNPQARLLSRPGEAIYNSNNGLVDGNSRFQVAWLSDDDRDRYLERVRERAASVGWEAPWTPIVFEGAAPADVTTNAALAAAIDRGSGEGPPRAWIGDPVAIRESVAVTFRRQAGSNLLVVGQDEELAVTTVTLAALSLIAGSTDHAGDGPLVDVLDFGSQDGTRPSPFTRLAEGLPATTLRVGRRRQLADRLAELAAEVRARVAAEDDGTFAPTPPRFLVIFGLQRARDLRPDDTFAVPSFGLDDAPTSSPSRDLEAILRDGPDVGIHVIVWCDTVTSLNRGIERRAQGEFGVRLAFQMSADDSATLIDTPAASKLGPHRALLFVEDQGSLEKLRPYAAPPDSWLGSVLEVVRERTVVPA